MGLDLCHVTPSLKTKETIEYFTADEFHDNPDYLARHQHLFVPYEIEVGKWTRVLFYQYGGRQRKGMNKDFIINFENGKLYFDIDSVKKASLFLEAAPGYDLETTKVNFQNNFIDNFVPGESIFFASW